VTRTFPTRLLLSLAICLTLLVSLHRAHAQSIGINFTGGGHLLSSTDQPGLFPGANWNNIIGGSGTNVALSDSSGTLTTALLTFNSTGDYDGFSGTNTPNPAASVLYQGGIFGSNISPEVSISITGIPYPKYNVYVYASADTFAQNTLSITDGITTYYYASNGQFNDVATSLLLTTSTDPNNPTIGPAQHQIFSNRTGSTFSLMTGGSITDVLSNNVFGLQIVNAVVPVASVTSTSPASVPFAGPAMPLTINGANFLPGAIVQWNGTSVPVTYISPTQLTVQLSTANLTSRNPAAITVTNPTVAASSPFSVAVLNPSIQLAFTLSRDPSTHQALVNVTATNTGGGYAINLNLTTVQLGSASPLAPTLPYAAGTLAPSAVVAGALTFPASVPSGSAVLKFSGTYTGGSFGGTYRVTVP
jgi:hypothetical protein